MNRRFQGIDILPDAVTLTRQRIQAPVRTESALMRDCIDTYFNNSPWVEAHLTGFSYSRVQRNSGADAILKEPLSGKAVFVRVQREGEPLSQAVFAIKKAISSKGDAVGVVIATGFDLFNVSEPGIRILPSPALQLREITNSLPLAQRSVTTKTRRA